MVGSNHEKWNDDNDAEKEVKIGHLFQELNFNGHRIRDLDAHHGAHGEIISSWQISH